VQTADAYRASSSGLRGAEVAARAGGQAQAMAAVPGLDEATALVFAAERGAARSIQAWMARGGDINGTLVAQAGGCYTPLQLASYTGHAVAVRTLLSCGADPSLTAATLGGAAGGAAAQMPPAGAAAVGHLPLHLAARYGHAAALEALLEGGVDPNAVSPGARVGGRRPGCAPRVPAAARALRAACARRPEALRCASADTARTY